MEQLARKIAKTISTNLHYDEEKEAVIAYGLIAIIQTFVTLLIVIILGIVFKILIEALLVTLSASLLRKYSGGSHASSIGICTATAVIYSIGCGLIIKYLLVGIHDTDIVVVITSVVFTFAYWIAYKKAPVDSPNKPIKSKAKITRMRKGTFIVLTCFLLLNGLLIALSGQYPIFLNYSFGILFGIIWQISTLTKFSAKLADIISFTH